MPRLSIIIVTFNSRAEIDSCLRALTEGTHIDREIVVVDNASTDGTAAHIRERWPGVRLMDLGATVCVARRPKWGSCPMTSLCSSFPWRETKRRR